MATIGYNQGYYSRSKYNDLAFQAEATIQGVSGVSATRQIHGGSATIQGVSGFTAVGTQIDQGAVIGPVIYGCHRQQIDLAASTISAIRL